MYILKNNNTASKKKISQNGIEYKDNLDMIDISPFSSILIQNLVIWIDANAFNYNYGYLILY